MSKFSVVVHHELEGGYWGEAPSLPGCYSQGETVNELLVNLREAIAVTLKFWRKRVESRRRMFRFWNWRFEADLGRRFLPQLTDAGWILKRVRGRHRIFAKPGEWKLVTVRVHGKHHLCRV